MTDIFGKIEQKPKWNTVCLLIRGTKNVYMAKKVTSKTVATKASKALSDGRSSARTKSIAGSALSQREKHNSRLKKK